MANTDLILPTLLWATAGSIIYAVAQLVIPILRPTIIRWPWPDRCEKNISVAFAGSFNPPHNGHIAMITYLCRRYGHVIVVVGKNPNKQYKVSPEDRVALIQRMIQETNPSTTNITVRVVEGYVWRTIKTEHPNVDSFLRGIRSWESDGPEERKLQILNTWGPLLLGPLWWPLPTLFLEGHPDYNHVSSTLVRNILRTSCRGGGGGDTTTTTTTTSKGGGGGGCDDDGSLSNLVPARLVKEVELLYADD